MDTRLMINDVEKLVNQLGKAIETEADVKELSSLIAALKSVGDSGVDLLIELLRRGQSVKYVAIALSCCGEAVIGPLICAMPAKLWASKGAASIYFALQIISERHPLSIVDVNEIARKAIVATLIDIGVIFNLRNPNYYDEDEVRTIREAVIAKAPMSCDRLPDFDVLHDITIRESLMVCFGRTDL